jgi:hypothetical protein
VLNSTNQETTHAKDGKATMIVTFSMTVDITSHTPFEHDPQVEVQKGHTDVQQAQGRIGGRGTHTHAIHLAITGLDSEAASIELKDAQRMGADAIGHVSKPLTAFAAIAAFAVLAGDGQVDGFGPELLIAHGVRGRITGMTNEPLAHATLFVGAGRDNEWQVTLFEETNDANAVKTVESTYFLTLTQNEGKLLHSKNQDTRKEQLSHAQYNRKTKTMPGAQIQTKRAS